MSVPTLSTADLFELALAQQRTLDRLVSLKEQELAEKSSKRVWVKAETITQVLGDAIAPGKVRSDLRAGYFKEGLHYIITSNGAKPGNAHYGFNLAEIRKFYETPPEKRRIY